MNSYKLVNSRKLNIQALWLSDRIVMPVLAIGPASS
jgi:hypothetical protein